MKVLYILLPALLFVLTGCSHSTDTSMKDGQAVGQPEPPIPDNDSVPIGVPLPPENLRAIRHSVSLGEVFWDASVDATEETRYAVLLDGSELSIISDRSFLINSLSENVAHGVEVKAIDGDGVRSAAARVSLNAYADVLSPVHAFELSLDQNRAVLNEGSAEGATFIIDVMPEGNEVVELGINPEQPEDNRGINVSLAKRMLDKADSRTSVTFTLPIGMRPLLPQTRKFTVVASSGEEVRQVVLVLNIEPVDAPDVYLLIGQSNMVGSSEKGAKDMSPGGSDERDENIWQLNVSRNNPNLFAEFEDFTNEKNAAIEPRFIEAEDPLHDPLKSNADVKRGTSVGPGLSFAKAALVDTTRKIYLVPAAWGASGFCEGQSDELAWNAGPSANTSLGGSGLLERALVRLRVTLRDTDGIFRAILWQQGEAESGNQSCVDGYARNLQLMVERIRREASVDRRGESARGSLAPVPFILATQSRGSDKRGDYSRWSSAQQQVDDVHRSVADEIPFSDWVNNDDLVPPAYPCGSSSCVHFGALASRETGRRFYQALKRVWDRDDVR